MRNKQWLRASLASLTIGGLALSAFIVACGDDDTGGGTTSGGTTDSGTDAKPNTGTDAGPGTDSGTDSGTDAGPQLPPAKIYFVHAGTDLGPDTDIGVPQLGGGVRVCFANSTDDGKTFTPAPFPASPTDASAAAPTAPPGLYIGTGGVYPTSGTDLEPFAIRPYLMNAKSLKARGIEGADPAVPRCPKLLTPGGLDAGTNPTPPPGSGADLVENKDFWKLPDIPTGALKKDHTYLLAVTGCTSNANAATGFCGPGDDGNQFAPTGTPGAGNLKVLVLELDTTTAVAADELAGAVVNLSPQQTALNAGTGDFNPRLINAEVLDGGGDTTDAGANTFKLTAEPSGGTPYKRGATAPSAIVKVKGLATTTGYFAFSGKVNPGPNPFGAAKLNNVGTTDPATRATVQFASTGSPNTQELYVNGKAYTFILVGTPGLNPAEVGSRALHYIGFPNVQ